MLHCEAIVNPSSRPHSTALYHLHVELDRLLNDFHPAEAAIEGAFFARNARTAQALGEVRGVVLALMASRGVPIYEYAPRMVKQSLTGRGSAEKKQVATMVRAITGGGNSLSEDETDALAVAVCHAQSEFQRRTGQISSI